MKEKDALHYLIEECGSVSAAVASCTADDGSTYHLTLGDVKIQRPPLPLRPCPLLLSTLESLATYLTDNRDDLDFSKLTIRVEPRTVTLRGALSGTDFERDEYVTVTCTDDVFEEGAPLSTEKLIIALRSQFAPTADRDELSALLTRVTNSESLELRDTGVSQIATIQRGLGLKEEVEVGHTFSLAPYRTFCEVAQPTSPYLLRVFPGPSATLYACDGGAWAHAARKSIADYLAERIPKEVVVLR